MDEKRPEPWQEALQKFLAAFPKGPLAQERIALHQALGRTLAGDVAAKIDLPPFSQALLEGYLVRTADTVRAASDSPALFEITGKIEPGATSAPSFSAGRCLEVVTGSFVESFMGEPHAVAGFRDVERQGTRVAVKRPFQPNENIELRGKEKQSGTPLLSRGDLIGPREISLLAGQGILEVDVARKPVVAVISSGNEVLSPQEPLRPGYVWDANAPALSALCEEGGGTSRFYGIMKDNLKSFADVLQKALAESDMVAISGGTVAGGKNFIADLIQSAASPGVIVDGVPMRSGRPLIMGVAGKKPIVCVAGYPPEAIRGFELFGKPSLSRLLGRE